MPRASISWDDLRFALEVARRGSHGGAGRALAVDPTTVGRRLTALEAALGARLFDRTPRGLEPTEAGRTLFARAERVEEEVLAAERELGGADTRVTGAVRITAGDGLTHYVLVPALPALRRAHPGLTVELRADTKTLDLSRREADVALRLVRPSEPALVGKKLAAMRFRLYASRAYIERRGVPRSAEDLAEHDFVGFDASLDALHQVRWLRTQVAKPRWVVRATSTTAQLLACGEGLGIALLATFVGSREERVVPVLPTLEPPPRETWIVVHRDVRKSARIAAVLAWLSQLGGALER
ncbi:MAG: LysR family transcriptional regulator [Polyangiaceae bacterium]